MRRRPAALVLAALTVTAIAAGALVPRGRGGDEPAAGRRDRSPRRTAPAAPSAVPTTVTPGTNDSPVPTVVAAPRAENRRGADSPYVRVYTADCAAALRPAHDLFDAVDAGQDIPADTPAVLGGVLRAARAACDSNEFLTFQDTELVPWLRAHGGAVDGIDPHPSASRPAG